MMLADPNCPLCHGEGQIWEDADSIMPVIGRPCSCLLRAYIQASVVRRLAAARFDERYKDASVEAFTLREGVVSVEDPTRRITRTVKLADIDRANRDRVAELALQPLSTGQVVAFTGPFGAGKTYLACALLRAQIEHHGKTGLYITTFDYIRAMLPDGDTPEAQHELRRLAENVDVLLLDDLGIEKSSAYSARQLWSLINERTTNGRALIITSNQSIANALQATRDSSGLAADQREAIDIGRRTFSRLAEQRVEPISWPEGTRDFRLERGASNARASVAGQAAREAQRGDWSSRIDGSVLDEPADKGTR